MNRETSLYLDIVRFTASAMVLIGHLSGRRLSGGLLWQLAPLMEEAVTIFFVLSGFVIAFATDTREQSASSYAAARAGRIYSVALPALLVTFALDSLGRSIRPDLYSSVWGYVGTGRTWQFICGLLFVNQIWFSGVQIGSILPYWSLGYEVWYYVIFGIATFAPARFRVPGVLVALVIVGPNVVLMLPLWLLGVWTYRLRDRVTPGPWIGGVLCIGSVAGWLAYEIWAARHGRLQMNWTRFPSRDVLPQDYLVALLFVIHLIGFRAISPVFGPILGYFSWPIRWAAGATFSVYLLHVPVAQFLSTVVPWSPPSWQSRVLIFGGTLIATFAFAEVTERRKEPWRRAFEALFRLIPSVAR